MRTTTSIILFTALSHAFALGQTTFPTRDSAHIFWQPGLKLTHLDYKGKETIEDADIMDKYGTQASASVGIWYILDIPQKEKDRYRKFEKIYFAPAFEMSTSSTRTTDTLEIAKQNLYLDICEIAARWARLTLKSIQDSTNSTGMLTIMYMTIVDEMHEKRLGMYRSYFKDVYIDKKPGAFEDWRSFYSQLLDETKQWATTPEECYRLMSGKPIEKGYIEAPTVPGSFKTKE